MSLSDSRSKTAVDVVESAATLLDKLRPYRPDVKSMTIDYLLRSSTLKLLVNVPDSLKRKIRDIEIPAYSGYSVYEVFEGDSLNRIDLDWQFKDGKWTTNASKLPKCETFFVILRGNVSKEALDQVIGVFCPEDPKRDIEKDRYWIQSGIKDMSILEKIYSELSVERVAVDVRVGIERPFIASIPDNIRMLLEARARADRALQTKDRQLMFREWSNYRHAIRQAGKSSIDFLINLAKQVLAPDIFLLFITVDEPYKMSNISPVQYGLVPDAVKVSVQTDLNFRRPAAQGNLTFWKAKFSERVSSEFSESSKKHV